MTHIPWSASYETHARTRVGGWVLRGGYADSVPRGPDHPTGGRYPRPPPGRSPVSVTELQRHCHKIVKSFAFRVARSSMLDAVAFLRPC